MDREVTRHMNMNCRDSEIGSDGCQTCEKDMKLGIKYKCFAPLVVDSAFAVQEGGNHYKDFKIQPTEYSHKNGLDWCQGNVVKYVTRHKVKNGLEDIKKAMHYLQFIAEMNYGEKL